MLQLEIFRRFRVKKYTDLDNYVAFNFRVESNYVAFVSFDYFGLRLRIEEKYRSTRKNDAVKLAYHANIVPKNYAKTVFTLK